MNAEQLKASILQQAVEGKLVLQLNSEEPVEQIGDAPEEVPFAIPEKWKWCSLGSLTQIIAGQAPEGNTVSEDASGMEFHQGKSFFSDRYVNTSGIYTNKPSKIAPKDSVLLSVRAPVGTVNLTDRELCIGRGLFSIVPGEFIDLRFLFFVLITKERELQSKSTGSTFKAVTGKVVRGLWIPLPPIEEQQRIVAKIEELLPLVEAYGKSYDRLQELNTELPGKLKASILQEAIQGKLVPQLDSEEAVEQIGDAPKEVPFAIPAKWKWIQLKDLTNNIGDGLHGTPEYDMGGECFFVNGNNLRDGLIVIDEKTKRISESTYKKLAVPLDETTLFVSINGTIGNTAYYNGEKIALGKSACFINVKKNTVDKRFLSVLIHSNFFKTFAKAKSTGTTIRNLGLTAIRKWYVPVPPLREQQRIVNKVLELLKQVDALSAK